MPRQSRSRSSSPPRGGRDRSRSRSPPPSRFTKARAFTVPVDRFYEQGLSEESVERQRIEALMGYIELDAFFDVHGYPEADDDEFSRAALAFKLHDDPLPPDSGLMIRPARVHHIDVTALLNEEKYERALMVIKEANLPLLHGNNPAFNVVLYENTDILYYMSAKSNCRMPRVQLTPVEVLRIVGGDEPLQAEAEMDLSRE